MSRGISALLLTPLHSRPAAARPRRKLEDPGSLRCFPTIPQRFPAVYVNGGGQLTPIFKSTAESRWLKLGKTP